MAEKPYKIYDRRSSFGYTNVLYEGATQTGDRKSVPMLDRDTTRNISNIGRRTLMTLGRYLFSNFDIIRGMIREQASIAVDVFQPQYYGRNKTWGNKAEEWLYEWHKIFNVRGWSYDCSVYRRNLVISILVDGDLGTLLTETDEQFETIDGGKSGYPLIQVIPSHRIGSRYNDSIVLSGLWSGRRIIDGTIVDDQGRVLAHRVVGEDPSDFGNFRDISANSLFTVFDPDWSDQARGISSLASLVFPSKDVKEWRQFEQLAQKAGAVPTIMEWNESGEADATKAIIGTPATAADATTAAAQSLTPEYLDGGTMRYFKANSGCKIESFKNDRPSSNQREFEHNLVRAALYGAGWSIDFGLDPSKIGGAPMRVAVDRIRRTISRLQDRVGMAHRRVDGYGLSKAIMLGQLDPDPDWWKWKYQAGAQITADAKYDSDISIQELNRGITTMQKECGKRGEYWEDVQDEAIAVEKRLQERCKAEGVDPNRIILLTPNGNPPTSGEPPETESTQNPKTEPKD